MNLSSTELLHRLGAGASIDELCRAAAISRSEFNEWWKNETQSRVPDPSGSLSTGVSRAVSIDRDQWGIPHIFAETDEDLFFGFGLAMAQDRLFQLDYLRRKAHGRLAEVLGKDGLETDIAARTLGLTRIAEQEWSQSPPETRTIIQRFSDGINAHIEATPMLPIEFELLDYSPESWSPLDCLAIATEFRSYLTVRLPIICAPELARRSLGEGPLLEAFLQGEADEESILPSGAYPSKQSGVESIDAPSVTPTKDRAATTGSFRAQRPPAASP